MIGSQSSPLINNNITTQKSHTFLHTSMVSHRGVPISFAMRDDGRIFYSVLDMSNTEQNSSKGDNDKNYWSKVVFEGEEGASRLSYPSEIMQVGYGVVPNFQIDKYDEKNNKIVHKEKDGKSFDEKDEELTDKAIEEKTDPFYSSTARLGAKGPFQVLSDGKYIYLFRQSVADTDNKENLFVERKDNNNEIIKDPIVNNTLLVDRFILSGTVLKLSREIRYQRSRHKTEPKSRKDTLAAVDMEGKPFHEPTRELVFANNLKKGNFSALLIPGKDSEEQRWQIFTADSTTNKINSFNIRFDYSIVFDTSDSQIIVDEFIEKYSKEYNLGGSLISKIQEGIAAKKKDEEIADNLLRGKLFSKRDGKGKMDETTKGILKDDLAEIAYIVRTGVTKDDFILESTSEWPLIEYTGDGKNIMPDYLENGALIKKYQFQEKIVDNPLQPQSSPYTIENGLSSCYYYQQEMGSDNKPMKNKASVMLAMGLEYRENQYVGILNFAVAASGRLSRLTTDAVNMPDINMQALDENHYVDLAALRKIEQERADFQKMGLLDIDPNGLSTSGGVLKFAYTNAAIGESQGSSDAVRATAPYLFDDSLGRVNLYFKGAKDNFFVLYFNPAGSKSIEIKDSAKEEVVPPLSLKPRLDCDMEVKVTAEVNKANNTCTLTMSPITPGTLIDNKVEKLRKKEKLRNVETWSHLPKRLSQISSILNGNGELPLGTLEPMENNNDPRAAYLKPSQEKGILKIRTTVDNNLMFQVQDAYANELAGGDTHSLPLSKLSGYLANNITLRIAQKSFSLDDATEVELKADIFYKSYLSGMVNDQGDIDKLWDYMTKKVPEGGGLLKEINETEVLNTPQTTTISETSTFLANDTTLTVTSAAALGIAKGDYFQIESDKSKKREILRVRNIYGNDIEVSRGQLGTTAVDHSKGATVTFNKCRINGALTSNAGTLTVTSATALGIAKGDRLKIDNEILLVDAVSANDLTVKRGEEKSTKSVHQNGSVLTIHKKGVTIAKGYLKHIGKKKSYNSIVKDKDIKGLELQLLKDGNEADKKARLAKLRQSLISLLTDVAKVRIITFNVVQDTNTQKVDRLEAGLAVSVMYDYSHFTCNPTNLSGRSASKWEHHRSYLFNASVNNREEKINEGGETKENQITPKTEISNAFDYTYTTNNSIGKWEDWDAGLALKMKGAVLSTDIDQKLETLKPTEKGLSVEAWVKPSEKLNKGKVLYYKRDDQHYSLGIEKDKDKYKCIATLGRTKYTTQDAFAFDKWRHLAFTHKKYWGYQLTGGKTINCGSDSSLNLTDEFTLEVLVKIDSAGTLLEKKGEYSLVVKVDGSVEFKWGDGDDENNFLSTCNKKYSFKQFKKITLIRSRNKPLTKPSIKDYQITGEDKSKKSGEKWYAKDKSGKEKDDKTLLKGLAEKQDQMETKMDLSRKNMFGNTADQSPDANPKYYHTLIVTDNNNNSTEWTSSEAEEIDSVEAYNNFIMGSKDFSGTFDSVRIWNRALSVEEAKALGLPKSKAGLLSHWRMTEGKGKYLYDNVGENHGKAEEKWVDSPRTDQKGQFQFYVDGVAKKHDTPEVESNASGNNQLSIGGIKTSEKQYSDEFAGTLEEIRIWNTPLTNEQITDNAFGRLKGEWEQLLANYTFDMPDPDTTKEPDPDTYEAKDAGFHGIHLKGKYSSGLTEVLSTAPVATEIPQVRSALTGVLTEYNDTIYSRPGVVEYGDVQKNDDGTLNGILKRCYSFIDKDRKWHRMTGYKVGNLVSQWYGQAQFAPQVMGYLEGPPPVPAENFPLVEGGPDANRYAFGLNNSINFHQAEEVSYNYSTSKENGWNIGVDSEGETGMDLRTLIAPFGIGISINAEVGVKGKSNWESSGKRSQSYERGTSVSTDREFSAALAGYDDKKGYYKLGNTGYALVKSKTADIYLLRLEHNNALVSISWQPNPDIPEDVNIIPFPINPLYTKQGTLDGKFSDKTDNHYPQAHGAYGQYSYFKPREAYKLKKQIEREKAELKAYFEDSFDVEKTNGHFKAATAATGVAQLIALAPGIGPVLTSVFNQSLGQVATHLGYNNTKLKDDLAKMGSQRNLVNTYVWTIEGGFYAESTEVAETQQETYAGESSLSLGGAGGLKLKVGGGALLDGKTMFSSGSSFTLSKSKTKKSSTSFGLDVSVDLPTSPRYKYAGIDGRSLTNKGLITPGTVDAYRFMSFYLEPKAKNFVDLFSKVIDPIWLDESPDPNAQALRQAAGNIDKAKPCWRIMHRVTYVSRILPEFQPEAPPSLEKSMRVKGIESNYMLIKKFEPYVKDISNSTDFFKKVESVITEQIPEFYNYREQIKNYLALYFNIE